MLALNERIQIVLLMAEFKSPTIVQRKWPTLDKPTITTIRQTYERFLETGSVYDRPRSGRPSADGDTVEKVKQHFEEHPTTSHRKAGLSLSLPPRSIGDMLKHRIGLKCFKISRVQQLLQNDHVARNSFCIDILDMQDRDPTFINRILFSDESNFSLNGTVSSHNAHIYGYENPHKYQEIPLKSPSVTVWASMSINGIIGPYFFDGTVDGNNYENMLANYLIPTLKRRRICSSTVFQQDGAPPHWSLRVRNLLNQTFKDRWIGRNGPIAWPARSPDLTPLDYFLWGYVKELVYSREPKTIADLKRVISEALESLTQQLCQNTFKNLEKRLRLCVKQNGAHFEHLL